eukprot:jgi/Mesvir1/20824/Mv07921-RA.1
MPRELITIQVGQCGNQIGTRFWDLALREHANYNTGGRFDEAMSSFFRNVDERFNPPRDIPAGEGRKASIIQNLKARAIIVDMEEGVVNGMLKGSLKDVFDNQQLLTDVSGSGNNWAHGYWQYGPQYRADLLTKVSRAVEACDSLQSFLLLHSLGGGTGSGLGSYILGMLHDEYPDVYRFAVSVFPSQDDDVVTSPYNSILSLGKLIEHADCVFPLENQALMDICGMMEQRAAGGEVTDARGDGATSAGRRGNKGGKSFDNMNSLAANLLLNLTSSVRFEGSLNVDLNEIAMNLVPFPRMHFLLASMSPLMTSLDKGKVAAQMQPRGIDQAFSQVFARDHQMIKADPRQSTYLACGLLLRGESVTISDINRNVARLKSSLRMVYWNTEGFKLGLCSKPPVGLPYSLLSLANNCCIRAASCLNQPLLALHTHPNLYCRVVTLPRPCPVSPRTPAGHSATCRTGT